MKTPEQIENERLAPAGVPAGATHVCARCGQYWSGADGWPEGPVVDPTCLCNDIRPIAEAGPAPTTAAPAEPRECVNPYHLKTGDHNGKTCYSVTEPMPLRDRARALISSAPAEQLSGKRTGFSNTDEPFADLLAPAEQPGKATDPRPAQPSKEKIEKARKLAMKIFAFHNSGNADLGKETAWIEAYAEHVVAPLREERDRLACELEAMRRERNGAQSQRDQERARAEQAEARLSAAPSEAPRHCRICEEPMSDTCEECQ